MADVGSVKFESNINQVEEELELKASSWLEAVGIDAASTAADKAPVDTGRLKNSISYAVEESENAVYIGTNVEYGIYQEFGTSKGVPGKHFIQFGATAHASEYKRMLEQNLKK